MLARPLSHRAAAASCAAAAVLACVGLAVPATAGAARAASATTAVRVNQAGYASGDPKPAFLMGSSRAVRSAPFEVVDRTSGAVVLRGTGGEPTGRWNRRYGSVARLDLSALTTPGTYVLRVGRVQSPPFRVAPRAQLMAPLAGATVKFFQAQRDGDRLVPGVARRRAAHLADHRARVYAAPDYGLDGELHRRLTRTGTVLDASGGWYDAGDYLKFTGTTAYSVTALLLAGRSAPATPGLAAEAAYGAAWLDAMWDDATGTLFAQVGLGEGGDDVLGDHDVWRLPQDDDHRRTDPGDDDYFVRYRPVFPATTASGAVSPNLAGRVAAAFALMAQAATDRPTAEAWLAKAAAVYARADRDPGPELVTVFPTEFYPEESWADDLELAAAELARAARTLGDAREGGWIAEAERWARDHEAEDSGGTLGVADVSALAHAELLGLGSTAPVLLSGLKAQLDAGVDHGHRDAFRAASSADDFDAVPFALGLAATSRLYEQATGDPHYRAFAAQQLGWVLGANAWGTSFMVGAGTVYPRCLSHQIANLTRGVELTGAVVNGPNATGTVGTVSRWGAMKRCAARGDRPWHDFDGRGARYLDDVAAWQTVEPALDFTATAALAFALSAAAPAG